MNFAAVYSFLPSACKPFSYRNAMLILNFSVTCFLSSGDSGGPLIRKGSSSDDDVLVGVVSWGRGCAEDGVPGVYARVSYFYEWIVATACSNFPDEAPEYMECRGPEVFIIEDRPTPAPTIEEIVYEVRTNAPTEFLTTNEPTETVYEFTTEAPTEFTKTNEQTESEDNNTPSEAPIFDPTSSVTLSPLPTTQDLLRNETQELEWMELEEAEELSQALFVSWAPSWMLRECQGHCDNDEDCEGDLVCFNREFENANEEIPGCTGVILVPMNVDVCIVPIHLP